ncbi:MAG: plastocyanin/azurin family copper-binding protein [Nitrosopumilus sp.]|nr:plastocyanin/azurin family copper-binding protein [Nitrosopumilus sp.]MDH3490210.1 plastocyanin/azurin family copper-binding protein [Nitrosopumilus sp.]MDH3516949.1 plastocyanin/azurin family copper-binding protein [Nitrosopumilus sp.]MDH3565324.1 plastocyanin/azurin family copper-binding protein [Nitrosopumilus sp.]MDH5417016.1 plastocyanin/azurin family copper-binding protein [Nitrosopumilus sp.]
MTSMDKAAIAFSIAIVVVGVAVAFSMSAVQDAGPVVSTPTVSAKTVEPKVQEDPFADLANKVKQEAPMVNEEKMKEPAKEPVKMEEKVEVKETKPIAKEPAAPQTHKVAIPVGTAVPGCESNNACYTPADITIKAGDKVTWNNVDTAAHTVTGGSPADGPSGVFDSSLVMANADYTFTFNDKGSYKYFCMVHPWMVGSVTVN